MKLSMAQDSDSVATPQLFSSVNPSSDNSPIIASNSWEANLYLSWLLPPDFNPHVSRNCLFFAHSFSPITAGA
jgi:hypothetical protein